MDIHLFFRWECSFGSLDLIQFMVVWMLSSTKKEVFIHYLQGWVKRIVHRGLPRVMGPELRRAGFEVRSTTAIPIVNTKWNADEFSFHLVPMMSAFASGSGSIPKQDAKDWLAEMRQLGSEGRYFFSLNRYLVVATGRQT